jgi:hypothetical protein
LSKIYFQFVLSSSFGIQMNSKISYSYFRILIFFPGNKIFPFHMFFVQSFELQSIIDFQSIISVLYRFYQDHIGLRWRTIVTLFHFRQI